MRERDAKTIEYIPKYKVKVKRSREVGWNGRISEGK